MSITPPVPDATSNQFKRSIVLGKFAVCNRFQYYDASGTPSGEIIDTGNSIFYGDMTVKGTAIFDKNVTLPNYYDKTYVDGLSLKGETGPKGETGTNGTDGVTGPKGETGTNGTDGVTGPKGDTGFTGPEGIQGFTGPRGAEGLRGFTGPGGEQGVPGTSYLTQSGTNLYYTGGNFGIGKVPTTALDVNGTLSTTSLNTGTLTLGNVLKYGGTSTNINIATNLTFPLHNYYYVYQNSIDGFLDIQLPDVHNQTIPPFQFTIVNMYAADTYGLVPYSSSASTPTFLYSKTKQQLASRNQVYNVSSSTSIFLTIHYFDKNWYIM